MSARIYIFSGLDDAQYRAAHRSGLSGAKSGFWRIVSWKTLETGFVDNTKARLMTPDGSYKRPCAPGDEPGLDSQIAFYKRAYLMAGNEFCEGK